jgi:hypothetical protein
LTQCLDIEDGTQTDLLEQKIRAFQESKLDQESLDPVTLLLVNQRVRPQGGDKDVTDSTSPATPPRNESTFAWVKMVPVLKIRCIAAYFLQHAVAPLKEAALLSYLTEENASNLFAALNRSRRMADLAVRSEDLAHAFQEAMLSEWGDDDDQTGEEALVNIARLSQTQGSAMFYLTQTAGATQASIWLLSALFKIKDESKDEGANETKISAWQREHFAAPLLLDIITDVLTKFVESESKEGKRIDPNVWRSAAESGVKVAVYCTSFASVVVELLNVMLSFDRDDMKIHGSAFFPMICRLIQVQSDEIRLLVQTILIEKFGPILEASNSVDASTVRETT